MASRRFGKGLVQTVSPLSENTGLALTTARYYTPSGRLIQRDYKDVSLYDYLYNHKNPAADGSQADRRRPPGIRRRRHHSRRAGERAEAEHVPGTAPAARRFLPVSGRRGQLHHLFPRDQAGSHQGLRGGRQRDGRCSAAYLDKEKIAYTDADIAQNLDWIKREIKKEAFISVFGLTGGLSRSNSRTIRKLSKAIESIPQARALYENVRSIIAQRTAGTGPQQQ